MDSRSASEVQRNRLTPRAVSPKSSAVLHATALQRREGFSFRPGFSTRLTQPSQSTVPRPAHAMPMAAAAHAVVVPTIMIATPMATRVHDGVHAIAYVMRDLGWDGRRWRRWWRRRECKSGAGGKGKAESQQRRAQGERCGRHGKLPEGGRQDAVAIDDRHHTVHPALFKQRAGETRRFTVPGQPLRPRGTMPAPCS
jgi:hypothetical protein